MARAAQDKRLVAVERLQAGIKMATGVFVIDGHGDVNLDAAKRVDDFAEAVEVDFRVMRDVHARQLGNRLHGQRRAAEHVRGVQLVHAVFAHVNHGVAMQRHQRDLLAHRSMRASMMLSVR